MVDSTLSFSTDDGIIAIEGLIDRDTVPQLLNGIDIEKLNAEQITLDLAQVDKVDTAGLAWILKLKAHTEKSGQTLVLKQVPEQLKRLASLGGVDTLLN